MEPALLHLQLFDEYHQPCCANVGIYQQDQRIFRGYIGETGVIPLDRGVYRIVIRRGKQYWPLEEEITVNGDTHLSFTLKRLQDPKLLGFYAFDAHSHISRAKMGDEAVMDMEKMSVRARGEDWHIYFAGTPYDGENHLHVYRHNYPDIPSYRAYYRPLLDRLARPDYIIDPGGELIKYRFGHIVLANFEEKPPVDEFRDPLYHAYERDSHVPCTLPPPFCNIPPSRALKKYRNPDSFAFFAHPTSWWRLDRNQAFVTNIASTIAFDALTGMADAMVVQGYEADKPSYRNLWYALLNAGYRLTGIAETDTCGDDPDHLSGKRMVEPFRTYARSEKLGLNEISAAVRRGDCFASSGPLLDYTLDGARPGSILPWEKDRSYQLNLQGWRCCEGTMTEMEIIANGESIARLTPDEKGRAEMQLSLPKEGYVLCLLWDEAGNLAVGNPIYVRNTPFLNDHFRARVTLDVKRNGRGARGVYTTDECPEPMAFEGKIDCKINPMTRIFVTVDGETKTFEPFFDPQLQDHFRYAYSGAFLADFPDCRPGEAPVAAFRIPEILDRLGNLTATLDFGVSEAALLFLSQSGQ